MLSSALFLLLLLIAARGNVTASVSGEKGLRFQDHTCINTIIDFYVSADGSYHYLDYDEGNTYMYKVARDGDLVFKQRLPGTGRETDLFYKKMVVDSEGFIYIAVTEAAQQNRLVERDMIRKYGQDGKFLEIKYEAEPEEPIYMGSPFYGFSGRFVQIQLLGDTLYVFDRRSEQEIALLRLEAAGSGVEGVEQAILELDAGILRELVYTAKDEIFFLNRRAELYRVDSRGVVRFMDTGYNGHAQVIPYTLSTDEQGNIYYTDAYNGFLLRHAYGATAPRPLYDFSIVLDGEKGITLGDLRKIKVFNENVLLGHSLPGSDARSYLAGLAGDSSLLLDRLDLTAGRALGMYGLQLGGWLAGIMLLFLLLYLLLSGRISLLTKQIIIFLPLFLVVLTGLALFISQMVREDAMDLAFEKVSSLAEATARLVDAEEIKKLDHPRDDFGPAYLNLDRELRLEREALYFVTYFVEDGRVFVGIDDEMQSRTPVEYLYDKDTVGCHYQLLRTGKVQTGVTVDSLGEWIWALAPIVDAGGETVGIMEQGLYADSIYREVEDTTRHLLGIFMGIAVVATVVLVIMLKYSLRALDLLKFTVAEVAAGRWDAKVNIRTRDEFRDIGLAFNRMSDRIQEYIDEITELNQAYVKFVPEKFISLLGKRTVQEVQSGDQVVGRTTIMYVKIRNIEKHSQKMDMEENYLFINRVLESIAGTVNEHHGVIERFEGAGAIVLFKESSEDALLASLKLMEEMAQFNLYSNRQVELGITISSGQVLLGVVGHKNRLSTTVISEEMDNIHVLEKVASRFGIKLLLTGEAVQGLTDLQEYSYRYAGRVRNGESARTMEIYEFLDSYGAAEKQLKLKTRDTLEAGIAHYQAGEFLEARKKFIHVIRTDQGDLLAKAYLFRSEKFGKEEPQQWEGILDYF